MKELEDVVAARPPSEMTLGPLRRLGFVPRLLCRTLLSKVRIDAGAVEHVRNLAKGGSIVYVMRYRSLVDTLLVVFVLMREGLPLPEFVAGVSTLWLRPLREIVSAFWNGLWSGNRGAGETPQESWEHCRRVVTAGKPVLIFMRARATGVGLYRGNPDALQKVRRGREYLREIVISEWSRSSEVYVVPLAVLRGHGYRHKESRLETLLYTVQEAPGEMKRLLSLIWNASDASITVGKHVDLREFVERYRDEGAERIVRRLARALQIFLHREERVVLGPTLLPKRVVCDIVVDEPEVRDAVAQVARESGKPEERVRRTAEKDFHEMAASFHGSYFTFLAFVFNRLWRRMFKGLETPGLEKVIDCVKLHPVVLVPCHRSHFDYLILSYIFHINHLSPPHIAAGNNLSFWPLGPLFRGGGAYFIRRSFGDDPVYKAVFRSYLKFLIREGYTQEFFIEGGRSRSGKLLTPKLGMLSAIVNAFVEGARRDLYLVPVSIHYGRVVEEQAYSRELGGGEKEKESLSALLRARSVLRQTYGAVVVSFADPISLNEALGDNRERLRQATDEVEEEKRRFTQKLAFRILREINDVTVAGSTAVSATVLLGSPRAAWRYSEFLPMAQQLVHLLRHRSVDFTAALERNQRDFLESLSFLEYSGLVRRVEGGQVIEVPAEKRVNLDFYKNNTIHFFLVPALLLQVLRGGVRGAAVCDAVRWWLDLYRWEFPLPEGGELAGEIETLLGFLRAEGALAGADGETPQPENRMVRALSKVLDNFHEAYWVTVQAIGRLGADGTSEKAFRNAVRKGYEIALMLGDVCKPEGNSTTTVNNALSRYAEMQLIELQPTGKGRDRRVVRGARFDDLAALEDRLRAALSNSATSERSPKQITTLN
jgi:glycerol-3-phosphate O-acyltransferase